MTVTPYDPNEWSDAPGDPDSAVNAAKLGHMELGIQRAVEVAASRVRTVNGDTGEEINLGINNLVDVNVDAPEFNEENEMLDPGPEDGDFLGYDATLGIWRNLPVLGTGHSHEGTYALFDPAAQWILRGTILAAGEATPDTLPESFLIFDAGKPSRLLVESVNIIEQATGTVTLPDVLDHTVHHATLIGNTTFVFPMPAAGKSFTLVDKQDTTGGRTKTFPTGIKWPNGTQPTWETGAGVEYETTFYSRTGTAWRAHPSVKYPASGSTPNATPTMPNSGIVTGGSSNVSTNVPFTLPGVVNANDVGYALCSNHNTDLQTFTAPTGWTTIGGPYLLGTATQVSYLIKRIMDGTEDGTTVNHTWGVGGRVTVVWWLVRGSDPNNDPIIVDSADSTVDTTLAVPSITPEIGNSLLVHAAAIRWPATTGRTVAPATGYTERQEADEGRGDTVVNYGCYLETRALTGQANTLQSAVNATYGANAQEFAVLLAIPPTVTTIA